MSNKEKPVHPYIPNSAPQVKAEMLKAIGVTDVDELYSDIPESLRFRGRMNLPDPFLSEYELKRHVESVLAKNKTCKEYLSFLGAGCYQHYVPAVVDEIVSRSEFLTAYAGEPYEDHGRFQTLFEYESMMGELLDLDVVNVPTYDWCQAASTSMRMCERITDRTTVLLADTIHPDRRAAMTNYCHPEVKVEMIAHDPATGYVDLDDLKSKLNGDIAGVYFENPNYLGIIDPNGQKISGMAHEAGALSVVGVDPISLGVLKPPSNYGADICVGDIQSLGIHMGFGGNLAGFIATRDEEKFVMEFPSRLFGICYTEVEGEWGFSDVAYDRTSFGVREKGKEFIGTAAALWGIGAAVYMALMGPNGFKEMGTQILQKSQYAMKKLSEIPGVKAPKYGATHFKEFVIDFTGTGKTVEAIHAALLEKKIFGGKDLSKESPELEGCALYCVTEVHSKSDIDQLAQAIQDCVS